MSRKNVAQSINDMIDFMKSKITANLHESDINLDQETMIKISGLIDLSVSQAFSLAYGNVENAISALEKDLKKTSSKSSKKSA